MPISMSTFVEFHVNIQTITRHKATLSVYSVWKANKSKSFST